jgi:mannopine transport system permease protein
MAEALTMIAAPARTRKRMSGGRLSLVIVTTVILVFLGLPTLIVIPVSLSPTDYLDFPPKSLTLHWYKAFFTDPEWVASTLLSLRIGLVVMVVSSVVGTMAALGIVRGQKGGGPWVNALVTAPLVIPTIVYAIAVLLFFSKIHLNGSFLGFVFAHSALATPYVVLIVSAALYRFDASTELAALSLGASRLQAVWHVTLPSIRMAVATGAVFAFLTSFDDATVSFFLASLTDVTLPRKMFENLQFFISPVLAVVATLLTVLALSLVGGVQWLRARRTPVAEEAEE